MAAENPDDKIVREHGMEQFIDLTNRFGVEAVRNTFHGIQDMLDPDERSREIARRVEVLMGHSAGSHDEARTDLDGEKAAFKSEFVPESVKLIPLQRHALQKRLESGEPLQQTAQKWVDGVAGGDFTQEMGIVTTDLPAVVAAVIDMNMPFGPNAKVDDAQVATLHWLMGVSIPMITKVMNDMLREKRVSVAAISQKPRSLSTVAITKYERRRDAHPDGRRGLLADYVTAYRAGSLEIEWVDGQTKDVSVSGQRQQRWLAQETDQDSPTSDPLPSESIESHDSEHTQGPFGTQLAAVVTAIGSASHWPRVLQDTVPVERILVGLDQPDRKAVSLALARLVQAIAREERTGDMSTEIIDEKATTPFEKESVSHIDMYRIVMDGKRLSDEQVDAAFNGVLQRAMSSGILTNGKAKYLKSRFGGSTAIEPRMGNSPTTLRSLSDMASTYGGFATEHDPVRAKRQEVMSWLLVQFARLQHPMEQIEWNIRQSPELQQVLGHHDGRLFIAAGIQRIYRHVEAVKKRA